MKNQHLATVMQKEVSRKEFMTLFTLAAGSIFGFGHIIKLFTGKSLGSHKLLNGYSSNSYGK